MKSGLACALTLFLSAAEKAKTVHPSHTLRFIGTVDEEDMMRGAEAAVRSGWITRDDLILDLEPTDGYIGNFHKGRTWVELEIHGITAHASTPERGADAIAGIAEAISFIRRTVSALPPDQSGYRTTVTFGQITGGYRPYVVSDDAKVWIDIRPVPPVTADKTGKIIEEAISYAEQTIHGVHGTYKITGNRPAVPPHADSRLLKLLAECVRKTTGTDPLIGIFPGYTDTAVMAALTGNSNCMSYGPGKLTVAHKPDEYVDIADIKRVHAAVGRLTERYIFPETARK